MRQQLSSSTAAAEAATSTFAASIGFFAPVAAKFYGIEPTAALPACTAATTAAATATATAATATAATITTIPTALKSAAAIS